MAFCQGAIRHCYLLGQFQMEYISSWKQPFDERVQLTWLGKHSEIPDCPAFSVLLSLEKMPKWPQCFYRMFHSSLAFMAVASRISVSVMGHSEFCVLSWAVFDKGAGQNNNPVTLWVSASTPATQKESWDWCFTEHPIFLVPTGEFVSTGLHHYRFHTGPTCNAVPIKTLCCVILFIYILKNIQLEKNVGHCENFSFVIFHYI